VEEVVVMVVILLKLEALLEILGNLVVLDH
jgi:hypothetical protein